MATLNDLQILADELTQVSPPPQQPKGVNFISENNGRWVIERTGAGMYAVRAEYKLADDDTRTIKIEHEMTGYPNSLVSALKFAIMIGNAQTHYWSAV